MSRGLEVLALKESDVTKMLAASTHLGSQNVNFQMKQYIYKRNPEGINIIDLGKTYEKLILAARAIAAIENPADVFAISSRSYGQRAVLKFARFTGATAIAGRFTPGCFTNHSQATFREPRLLVVMDPKVDAQPISESSYVNVPVIAFANTDSPLRYVDIAIPCNNSGPHSVGLMWWMLAREVLALRGTIPRSSEWTVMPDLFFYRDPEEVEREEQAKRDQASNEAAEAAQAAAAAAQAVSGMDDDFGIGGTGASATGAGAGEDWTKEWSGGGADEEWSAAADSARWS